ncbi:MAG: polyprenyl synthetase family protein [Buchnera aphidicola (Nurudea yanoniella)]
MDWFRFFSIKKNRINNFMSKLLDDLPFQDSLLLDAMKYGVLLGGKRIRSVLMYILGKSFQVNTNIIDVLASSVEFIHAYSLIHDDLPALDNDIFRRGYDSCHIKFGESTAILAGNSLQCLSFNILSHLNSSEISDNKKIKMIAELSHFSGYSGICIGQFFDLESKYKNFELHELEKMYWYKTGSLISAAVRLILISSNVYNKNIFLGLEKYSKNISLAFQIRDDILDFLSDTENIMEYENCNRNLKRNTFPLIIGLKKSKEKLKELYKDILKSLQILSYEHINVKFLKKLAYYIITRNK